MGRFVHARQTPDGLRFRIWSTVVDRYLTPPLTRAEAEEALCAEYREEHARWLAHAVAEIGARLDRTAERGTSALDLEPTPLDHAWEEERCRACSRFHHAFAPRTTWPAECRRCGEPADDVAHAPPCAEETRR